MVDMDWVEIREKEGELIPVALIEVITYRDEDLHNAYEKKPIEKVKQKLCEYAERYWMPAYIVWTNPDKLNAFLVQRVGQKPEYMTEENFKSFLKTLT
jgi:hypothetical protein